jgi:hypothetical protein
MSASRPASARVVRANTVSLLVVAAALWLPAVTAPAGAAPGDPIDLDLQVLEAQPEAQVVGQRFPVYAAVQNTGPSAATSFTLTATIPAGLTIDGDPLLFSPGTASCVVTAPTVTCSNALLQPGFTLSVMIMVIADAPGAYQVPVVTASAETEPVPDPHPNSVTGTFTVIAPAPDLGITLASAPGPQVQGETMTVEGTLTNHGTTSVPDASLTYAAPANFRIDTFFMSGFGGCDFTDTEGTCDVPVPLYPGNSIDFTLTATPLTASGAVTHSLTASSGGTEPVPDPHPNTVTFDTVVGNQHSAQVDLSAAVFGVFPLGRAVAGQEFSLVTTVSNHLPATAYDVTVVHQVPAGLAIGPVSFASAGPNGSVTGPCDVVAQVVTCTAPQVEQGLDWFLSVAVTPAEAASGLEATSTVSSLHPEPAPDPNPNQSTFAFDVVAADSPATVSGQVTSYPPLALVEGATVLAYRLTDGVTPTASVSSAADGSYVFPELPPGTYQFFISPPAGSGLAGTWFTDTGSPGANASRALATQVVLAPGQSLVLPLQIGYASAISGRVTDVGGNPLAGVQVWAQIPGTYWLPQASTTTAADGTYTLDGLVDAGYEISFRPGASSGLLLQWYSGVAARGGATAVHPGTTTTGIDAVLRAPGSASGTVTGVDGLPLAGVRVVAFGPTDTWAGEVVAVTAADGSYTLSGLREADYAVRFVPPLGSGLEAQWFAATPDRGLATRVVVPSGGSVSGIDATWAPSP